MDHARRVPAVEVGEAFADPRAAADALRHQRKPVEARVDVALAQRAGHMSEARVEQNASASRKASTAACRKRAKKAVYSSIDPDASSSSTSRSGRAFAAAGLVRSACRRGRRCGGWSRAGRGAGPLPPRALAAHEPRAHAPGEALGERMDLRHLLARRRHDGCRGQRAPCRGGRVRADRRGSRPRRLVIAGRRLPSLRPGAGAAHRPAGRDLRRAAPGSPAPRRAGSRRMPFPRQNASNSSSKRRQSSRVAENSARKAGFRRTGREPAGDARTASASRLSARPTANPFVAQQSAQSGEPRGGPAAARAPDPNSGDRPSLASCDLADQTRGRLTRQPRAVLVRLEQADQRRRGRFRALRADR